MAISQVKRPAKIAMMPRMKEITLLQMDGDFTPDEFKSALKLTMGGCEKIYELQKKALGSKYQ